MSYFPWILEIGSIGLFAGLFCLFFELFPLFQDGYGLAIVNIGGLQVADPKWAAALCGDGSSVSTYTPKLSNNATGLTVTDVPATNTAMIGSCDQCGNAISVR